MTEAKMEDHLVRPMDAGDLSMVLAWRNHPDVRRHMFTRHEIGLEEHQHWFRVAREDPRQHLFVFEIRGVPQGVVTFKRLGSGAVADWGFYASPAAPAGTGKLLGHAALTHAFGQLQLHKVCGQALTENQRSIRLHMSLGFAQEGVLREQHFDGVQYQHIICFGMLGREWQSRLSCIRI